MNKNLLNEPYPFSSSLQKNIRSSLIFGAFVFCFLYFLQPFGINNWQSDTKTLQLFGYGLVTTFCLFSNYLVFRMLFPKWYSKKTWTVGKNILFTTLVFFSIGLGNLLYSVSQGFLDFSLESFWFYQGLTLTVGIFPVVISTLLVYNLRLKTMIREATQLNNAVQNDKQFGAETIHIPSQNKSEELNLNSQELLAIKAVENYIEVYANQEGKLNKTVLRNTLKNAEESLTDVKHMNKCHRSYLVNLEKVKHFTGNAQGLTLNFGESIELSVPVSRAYVKTIKESLGKN
ncbi:MAG: hypothetical protein ACJAV5_000249 [Vicingaceae bacterium]|jgi:hypothetical protein